MRLSPTPKAPPPKKSAAEDFMEAFKEQNKKHERDQRDKKRRAKWSWLGPWMDSGRGRLKTLALLAGFAFFALLADGMRRERDEFTANLAAFAGQVAVYLGGKATPAAPKTAMPLATKDLVTTAVDGTATVAFPDGSAVLVEPYTQFEVRLMDYGRTDVRDRSILVRSGAVVARVSKRFGLRSQTSICTPTAVAAARGTGFLVAYNPRTRDTFVSVVDGTVDFRTSGGSLQVGPGQAALARGGDPPALQPPGAQDRVRAAFDQLARFEQPPHWLYALEKRLLSLVDPGLRPIGMVPGRWTLAGTDGARRRQCVAALQRIQQQLAGLAGDQSPEEVSIVTLEGLQFDELTRDQVLDAFAGNMIEGYRKNGPTNYVLRARARDRARTLHEVTEDGVREVQE